MALLLRMVAPVMEHILNKHILVVDDEERMLRVLGKVLDCAGAKVTSTLRPEDAVEILIRRKGNMDLVMTDLRMPRVTGVTLVYALHLMFPHIPVIVLTAFGNPELRAECLRLGAADFLEKTMSAEQLLAAVDQVFAARMGVQAQLTETI